MNIGLTSLGLWHLRDPWAAPARPLVYCAPFPSVVWVITTFNWPGLESRESIKWEIYYPYPQHLTRCQACSWCSMICIDDAGEYREKEISGSSPSYIPRVDMWCSSHVVLCAIPRRYHGLPYLWVSPPLACFSSIPHPLYLPPSFNWLSLLILQLSAYIWHYNCQSACLESPLGGGYVLWWWDVLPFFAWDSSIFIG